MTESSALRVALDGRSPQEQAEVLGRVGKVLRDRLAALGDRTDEADAGITLAGRWADGETVPGKAFSDTVYSEQEQGVLRRLNDEADPERETLWNALTTILMYVAWLAYRASGERIPEDVLEVDEGTLDMLDEQWQETGTYDLALLSD